MHFLVSEAMKDEEEAQFAGNVSRSDLSLVF